jgi:hypothetical protein
VGDFHSQIYDVVHSRREQAETELSNMIKSVEAKRAEEIACDGMIIEKARFGDLSTAGGYIDATDQMQHLVDGSVLIFKGNKDFIEGMWDPTFMRGRTYIVILSVFFFFFFFFFFNCGVCDFFFF